MFPGRNNEWLISRLPGPQKIKRPNKGQIFKEYLPKYIKKCLKDHRVLYVLLKFSQNRLKKILFSSRLKKGQMAKSFYF